MPLTALFVVCIWIYIYDGYGKKRGRRRIKKRRYRRSFKNIKKNKSDKVLKYDVIYKDVN
jgi:hypothetical protein